MPYVPPGEALDRAVADLGELRARMGAAPWRVALLGSPALRVVAVCWPAGHATVPHRHPGAEEIFLVLEGTALFTIGDDPEHAVGTGRLVCAPRGVRHAIRVPDDGADCVLLAAVAPNEDRPDEAIE